MDLTLEQSLAIFVQIIIGDLVHQDYDHVTRKARLYKQLITGDDIEDLLIQFNPREDAIMFEQRKRITQVITPAVASSIMKPFYKVPRTDRVVKRVNPVDDKSESDKASVTEVLDKMDSFYGGEANVKGLDYFLQNRFIELTFTDPNTFIVTEFESFNNLTEKATPYPFEVDSCKARNFSYVNNQLVWLVAREDVQYQEPLNEGDIKELKKRGIKPKDMPTHKTVDGYKWIMYTDIYTIVYEQVATDTVIPDIDDEGYNPNIDLITLDNGFTYTQSLFNHDTGKVPAKRVGYKRDLLTDGRTFVNPFDDALCYFISSIKDVSEYCLSKSQHVFPQKLQYVPECQGESETNSCFKGRAALGGTCKVCRGSGLMPIHTSAQDVITFKLPDDASKMMDLNKVMAYMSPPIDLIKFQNDIVKQVKTDCHQTVFNSTALLKDSSGQAAVTKTATEQNFDYDSINDTLAPFAEIFSAFWLFEGDVIVRVTDNLGKVELIHRFPADFKMKSISDLYSEMQAANDSYAPSFLIELINDDIAATKFQDDPDQLQIYTVKKRLNPFRGMVDASIINSLNTDYTPLWKKVLYTNFEDIISEAEASTNDFYIQDYDKQKKIIKDLTDKMIIEINDSKPAAPTLKPVNPNLPAAKGAFAVGSNVSVIPGQEQNPEHTGVTFKVDTVTPAGDSFTYALTSEDGLLTATYNEDQLASA